MIIKSLRGNVGIPTNQNKMKKYEGMVETVALFRETIKTQGLDDTLEMEVLNLTDEFEARLLDIMEGATEAENLMMEYGLEFNPQN